MAENEQAQEKTEEPTQRRLEKAREDGDVLSSKEMLVFASGVSALIIIGALGLFSKGVLDAWGSLFIFSNPDELLTAKFAKGWSGYAIVLSGAAIFGIPTMLFIILTQSFVGNGLSFNPKGFSFKVEKLNIIKGLGRIFSVKGLVELIKAIAKVVFLTAVVITFLWFSLTRIVYLNVGSLDDGIAVLYRLLILFILSILIVLCLIAIGDYIWSRHSWLQKLRMSRQDMKEEFKETEGSPEVKSRMRRLQMEASQKAMQNAQAVEQVKDATVIITNPTHFAVAIRYDQELEDVPVILAMGKDILAKRIIEQADIHAKTVVRSPTLARALYYSGDVGGAISERLYAAVASILAYVYQLERGIDASLNDVEVPADMVFDEFGKPSEVS
ncbi:MAG: EscU/YscU/HrcU family type III secretion system export apparatus switch protein [Rhodobacterales bacterium]|nr:EscU/YscU/HrcU family type III secretion system export apparatus switch protein [Rhodobacterales bacterium]